MDIIVSNKLELNHQALYLSTGTPLLEEELRPARPMRPTPQPRNQPPETQPMKEDTDSSMTDV